MGFNGNLIYFILIQWDMSRWYKLRFFYWLVVDLALWKNMSSSVWDDENSKYMEKLEKIKKCFENHQPVCMCIYISMYAPPPTRTYLFFSISLTVSLQGQTICYLLSAKKQHTHTPKIKQTKNALESLLLSPSSQSRSPKTLCFFFFGYIKKQYIYIYMYMYI